MAVEISFLKLTKFTRGIISSNIKRKPLQGYSILAERRWLSHLTGKSLVPTEIYGPFISRKFSSIHDNNSSCESSNFVEIRLSKLVAATQGISRRQAETLIRKRKVQCNQERITSPEYKFQMPSDNVLTLSIDGSSTRSLTAQELTHLLQEQSNPQQERTRIWIVNKLRGELVSESDPQRNRPCMMQRLRTTGFSRQKLVPIGRLDMNTEGLILITNDGSYSHKMEHPSNAIPRTYRVRAHGLITDYKLSKIRRGVTIEGIQYKGMNVRVESARSHSSKKTSTNSWLTVTCREGKNRQIRKVFEHFGCKSASPLLCFFHLYKI